ncbi:hypothetical protein GMAR_ORF122 [Golden Marseillevirus]|uniref:hypothetical protein n=1 Tax=Golden Marseillevirus TaxID=1720526 RepID=UPI000877A8D1|nr:hypothetical protein GMAR_ORF122 [Golden Marseillevirus]ALX27496.1 hypothetical protein GMAR_ORF122 [Golden Marseillevirus]
MSIEAIKKEALSLFPGFVFGKVIQHNPGHALVCHGSAGKQSLVIKCGSGDTDVKEEVEIAGYLCDNQHENILCAAAYSWDKFYHCIYPNAGIDLAAYFSKRVELEADAIRRLFKGICHGVRHLHRVGIIHTDLKPENIFIDPEGNIKIGDFGNSFFSDECGFVEVDHIITTANYRSPDIIMGKRVFGYKLDVWSLGCLLFFIAEGGYHLVLPSEDEEEEMVDALVRSLGGFTEDEKAQIGPSKFWSRVRNRKPLGAPEVDILGKEGNLLLRQMLRFAENDRISSEEICSHKYFE